MLGFYDTDDRALYLVGDASLDVEPSAGDLITLAHEITHALQDQHFDLHAMQESRRTDNDRLLALQALVEGDATLLMSLYAQRYLSPSQLREVSAGGSAGSEALNRAPLVIQRELAFPYADGLTFLLGPYQRGGWTAINQVWRNPPASTEQILHPEKYVAGENPVEVETPQLGALLGPEWRSLETNTLGELDWRILFEQYTDVRTAERVAGGWGGDRFELLKRDRDGAAVMAARTAWDTAADAREFFDAYPRLAAARHPAGISATLTPTADGTTIWTGIDAGWSHILQLAGNRLTLIIASDPAVADLVASRLRP